MMALKIQGTSNVKGMSTGEFNGHVPGDTMQVTEQQK